MSKHAYFLFLQTLFITVIMYLGFVCLAVARIHVSIYLWRRYENNTAPVWVPKSIVLRFNAFRSATLVQNNLPSDYKFCDYLFERYVEVICEVATIGWKVTSV